MKLAVLANPDKYEVQDSFAKTVKWAGQNDTEVYYSKKLLDLLDHTNTESGRVTDTEEEAIGKADFIVAIGGDGTMLYTARLLKETNKPVLGVNTGRLGFMANTQIENLDKALECLKSEDFSIDQRFLLTAEDPQGDHYHALNEFHFSKKDSTSMISVRAEYDNMFINNYWADGLIVASPTGSTAYNLSSGGPIVMPDTHVMVLTPINPHTLTTRPLVLPSDRSLKITVEKQKHDVLFAYDSNHFEIDSYPFEVEIKRSEYSIDLIQLSGQEYFETLRNKLMWGVDSRMRY